MSAEALALARRTGLARAERALLIEVAWRCPKGKTAAAVSHQDLAKALGVGAEQVRRIARRLEALGRLAIQPGKGRAITSWEVLAPMQSVDNPAKAEFETQPKSGLSPNQKVDSDPTKKWVPIEKGVNTTKEVHFVEAIPAAPEAPAQNLSTHQEELQAVAQHAALEPTQLLALLGACSEAGCRAQDLHRVCARHLDRHQLRGRGALSYLLAALRRSPGRDWTWEARRDAEQSAEQASERSANQAFERFMGKIRGGETVPVRSPQTGEPLILKQRAEAPEFVVILGSQGEFKASLPIRMAFDQLISPPAE